MKLLPIILLLAIMGLSQAMIVNYSFYDYTSAADQGRSTDGFGNIFYQYFASDLTSKGEMTFAATENWTQAGSWEKRYTTVANNKSIFMRKDAVGSIHALPALTWVSNTTKQIKFYLNALGVSPADNCFIIEWDNTTPSTYTVLARLDNNLTTMNVTPVNAVAGKAYSFFTNGPTIWTYNLSIEVDNGLPPLFYSNSTNNTASGLPSKFSVNWTSSTGLNNYTFSFDNGNGVYVNDSVASMTGVSNWSNVTKTLNPLSNQLIRWAVYAWDTLGIMNVSFNQFLTTSSLFVRTFDENNPTVSKLFNMTISNATNSTSYQVNYTWFNQSFANIPTGLDTITITNNSCQTSNVIPRSYYYDTSQGSINLTAYLLCDGATPVLQTMLIQDQYLRAVQGATVTVYKVIGSSNATIAILSSDSIGQASTYLTALSNYIVVVSKFGYVTTVTTLTATGSIITIPISVNSAFNTFDSLLKYISWTLAPDSYLGMPLFNVTASVASSIPLDYYGLELIYANGTQIYFGNFTNTTGSTFTTNTFDRNQSNGTLYANLFVYANGYTPFLYSRTYSFTNSSDSPSSLTGIIAGLKASDMSASMKAVMAVFLSLFFAVGAGFAFGASGAGTAFVVALGFFGLVLGFVEENLIYLLVILAISLWAIMRGL